MSEPGRGPADPRPAQPAATGTETEAAAGGPEAERLVRVLDLRLQQAAFRAALAGRDRLLHPSLLEFLR